MRKPKKDSDFLRPIRLAALLSALAVAGCAQEEYPLALYEAQHPGAVDAAQDAPPTGATADATTPASRGPAYCQQARSSQSMPARLVVLSANAPSGLGAPAMDASATPQGSRVVLTSDLFEFFNEACKPCHTAASDFGQGGFQIKQAGQFASLMTAPVLTHVTKSLCPSPPDPKNPNDPMPPCSSSNGETYAQRSEADTVRQFAEETAAWLDAGSPTSFVYPPVVDAGQSLDAGDAAAAPPYAMTPQNGNAMTNIGNCIPSPGLLGAEGTVSLAKDALFAALKAQASGTAAQHIGLPEHLSDTDLVTLDSAALAQYGVIAYAPGYPLWSDNAYKLRHVRVPRGQSIHFNKATQQFEIPPNTRFYKTFTKPIIDTDNSYRYRKIETRLIVSRPDRNNADGTAAAQTALFGTYRWNDDESDATLVETPLNDSQPFSDTLLLYHTDEQLATDVIAENRPNIDQSLVEARAARHYAIPGSPRCIQCHMGSPSQSFILGFTPLQINRMPVNTHGVIEESGPDELTQLQRLIDAGIITGIDSPSDLLPLEQSEGSRSPRNEYELIAQGYMVGNCAHCHNPRGFPTVQNPVLKGVLDFLPRPDGGIFQFPLERYSPRVGRGLTGSTPIPYITPSLVDLPRVDRLDRPGGDPFVAGANGALVYAVYAPWRSILYRNVDAAFAYTDDFAIFPHMPMNTPGYDPRVKNILGNWMVSIPAARKHPEIPEYAYHLDAVSNYGGPVVDTTPQPYAEVRPGSPGYDDAIATAKARLNIFQTGVNPGVSLDPDFGITYSRYTDSGQTDDVLDPSVLVDPICHPIPVGAPVANRTPFPEHPHWVNTDLTDAPGPWAPRQSNWPAALVAQMPQMNSSCTGTDKNAYDDQVKAIDLLQSATLDQINGPSNGFFATTPLPFGLWQQQPGCNFASATSPAVHPVSWYTGAKRPHWMDVTNPPPDAPVYEQSPGAAVFKMICINCHGPMADSNGRLAQNLATMTGGNALVADFRDGLFGPVGSPPGQNARNAVFGDEALATMVNGAVPPAWTLPNVPSAADRVDDRAARYMAWMGLGGTTVNIPVPVLEVVAITRVLDQLRTLDATTLSANMLSQAKALCFGLLGPAHSDFAASRFDPTPGHGYLDAKQALLNRAVIAQNGDFEMWLHLCSLVNPAPVHVLYFPVDEAAIVLKVAPIQDANGNTTIALDSLVDAANYPAGAAVGDEAANVRAGLTPDNLWPWCIDNTSANATQKGYLQATPQLPICPAFILSALRACATATTPGPMCFGLDQANRWAVRGAVSAGMSVFTYVRSIENSAPPLDYNQCNLLK